MRNVRGRGVVVRAIVLLSLIASLTGGLVGQVAAAPRAIAWAHCYEIFECGTLHVPLDHDEPNGAKIGIALVRLPASDPEQRIGSLFLNPGGPGGSGVNFTVGLGEILFTDDVRSRFDIVGFDPRGIARSSYLRCFGNERQWQQFISPFWFPTTPEEEEMWTDNDVAIAEACEERGGRIADHMSTANVARDLDLLRAAVGDRHLNFVGYSYGSYLGVTYANLFPERVGALVVDGVLDPIAWSTGAPGEAATQPFSTRLRSDAGARATLEEFFRLCDEGGDSCPFSGGAAERFAALAQELRDEPVTITHPDGSEERFGYTDLIAITLFHLYDSFAWGDLAGLLAELDAHAESADIGTSAGSFRHLPAYMPARVALPYYNYIEGFTGVVCSDSDNPDSFSAWSAAGAAADEQFGYFGRLWTWLSSICAPWQAADEDRYMGPFDAVTANPVLVVGTEFDPATRYEGAQTVAGLLPNSGLLTVRGWGHTSLFLSQCADSAITTYLIERSVPARETVCEQDFVPFAD